MGTGVKVELRLDLQDSLVDLLQNT